MPPQRARAGGSTEEDFTASRSGRAPHFLHFGSSIRKFLTAIDDMIHQQAVARWRGAGGQEKGEEG